MSYSPDLETFAEIFYEFEYEDFCHDAGIIFTAIVTLREQIQNATSDDLRKQLTEDLEYKREAMHNLDAEFWGRMQEYMRKGG